MRRGKGAGGKGNNEPTQAQKDAAKRLADAASAKRQKFEHQQRAAHEAAMRRIAQQRRQQGG